MPELTIEAQAARYRLWTARRRASELQPFSPAWDAAMSGVEDLERQVRNHWRRSPECTVWVSDRGRRSGA
jgi:hypothetical protein